MNHALLAKNSVRVLIKSVKLLFKIGPKDLYPKNTAQIKQNSSPRSFDLGNIYRKVPKITQYRKHESKHYVVSNYVFYSSLRN